MGGGALFLREHTARRVRRIGFASLTYPCQIWWQSPPSFSVSFLADNRAVEMDVLPATAAAVPDPRLLAPRDRRRALGVAALGQTHVADHRRVAHDPHVRSHERDVAR